MPGDVPEIIRENGRLTSRMPVRITDDIEASDTVALTPAGLAACDHPPTDDGDDDEEEDTVTLPVEPNGRVLAIGSPIV